MPAYEHYDTASHDVETSPLFFDQPCTLSSKSTLSLSGGIVDERGSGGGSAP